MYYLTLHLRPQFNHVVNYCMKLEWHKSTWNSWFPIYISHSQAWYNLEYNYRLDITISLILKTYFIFLPQLYGHTIYETVSKVLSVTCCWLLLFLFQTYQWKLRKLMDLDEVLDELKHFGKFQAINYLLLSVAILFAAMFEASFIFTAGDLDYR